jgi:hypothetical protein
VWEEIVSLKQELINLIKMYLNDSRDICYDCDACLWEIQDVVKDCDNCPLNILNYEKLLAELQE